MDRGFDSGKAQRLDRDLSKVSEIDFKGLTPLRRNFVEVVTAIFKGKLEAARAAHAPLRDVVEVYRGAARGIVVRLSSKTPDQPQIFNEYSYDNAPTKKPLYRFDI